MHDIAALFAISASIATVAQAADAPQPKVVGFPFTRTKKHMSKLPRLAHREPVQMDLKTEQLVYNIDVSVGTPPQRVQLLLDTASSDTWLPHRLSYECKRTGCKYGVFEPYLSSTFEELPAKGEFTTSYEDGSKVAGKYFSDTLHMGGLNITHTTMGLATNITGDQNTPDTEGGIMGIAYRAGEFIKPGTLSNISPNVPELLLRQGHISSLAYSLWLNDDDAKFGNILFGGVDTEKYHGDLVAVPVVPQVQSRIYWFTVAFSGMTITNNAGKETYNRPNLALPVILDSGSTMTWLPKDLAIEILQGVGAQEKENEWLLPCSRCSSGASINYSFGGAGGPTIAVPFKDLCLPFIDSKGKSIVELEGEQACQFGIYPMRDAGAGFSDVDGIFGDTFLRSAYVVYSLHQNVIALAQTKLNATTSHIEEITDSSIPGVVATAKGVDVSRYTPPTSAVEFVPGPATFDFGTATERQSLGAAALAVGQLPPQLLLQLIVSSVAVVVAGLFGGSLVVLW